MTVLSKSHQGKEEEERRSGGDEGKIGRKLSEVNTLAGCRGQNELIDKMKMISIGGYIMKYKYSNRIERDSEIWCGL